MENPVGGRTMHDPVLVLGKRSRRAGGERGWWWMAEVAKIGRHDRGRRTPVGVEPPVRETASEPFSQAIVSKRHLIGCGLECSAVVCWERVILQNDDSHSERL